VSSSTRALPLVDITGNTQDMEQHSEPRMQEHTTDNDTMDFHAYLQSVNDRRGDGSPVPPPPSRALLQTPEDMLPPPATHTLLPRDGHDTPPPHDAKRTGHGTAC